MFIIEPSLLLRLMIGHVVGDFLLQSQSMVQKKKDKKWKSPSLYIHAGIYAAVVFVLSSAWKQGYWILPVLFISHTMIDRWKASRENDAGSFIMDQAGHIIVLAAVFFLLPQSGGGNLFPALQRIWHSSRILSILLSYAVVTIPIGRLMNISLIPFRNQLSGQTSRGLEPAGFWIGCLERTFLVSFILLDYLPGVALLLGLKSLFRFGEIKDPSNRKEAEYILIGTLLSFGFAIAIGLLTRWIYHRVP